MVGFYTGEPGSIALRRQGTDAIASGAGDVLGATAESAFVNNITPRTVRATLGGGLDEETQSYWRSQNDPRTAGSDVDVMAEERGAPPAMLTPEDANQRFGIPGVLSFDKPVAEPVASDLRDHKHAEIVRQDVIARREGGATTGMVARGAVSLAMGLLDPVNLAAGFLPGFGEARIAGALGMDLAGSLGARVTARALSGASAGAVGMAALEPFNYVLDQHEHNDWTMGEAARNIAFGALLGSAVHTGIGGLVGHVPDRIRDADPEVQAMALRGAVAQVAEGRPVDIASALDLVEASTARRELEIFQRRSARIDAEISAAEDATRVAGADPGRVADAQARLDRAHSQADELRAEMEAAHASARINALDEPSRIRLSEVDTELSGVIPRARREALEQERILLTEGRGDIDVRSGELEAARSAAQAQGLLVALGRAEAEIAAAQQQVEILTTRYQARQAIVDAGREQAEGAARIVGARAEGQQGILRTMAERAIRRYAASIGVALEGREAAQIAREVLTAQPGEAADIIAHALRDIATRSPRPEIAAVLEHRGGAPADRLLSEETLAERTLRDNARQTQQYPDAPAIMRENAAAIETTPKAEGPIDKQIAELQKNHDAIMAQVQSDIDSGRLTEAHTAPLREADVLAAQAEKDAKGYETAAACIAARIV